MSTNAMQYPAVEIDQSASLVAHHETFINAPLEQVWALQTNIDGWAKWQPDVSSARLEGDLAQGTIFRWKAAGLNIVSTLQVVESQQKIGWTGVSLGMKAVHMWQFEARDGGTWVRTEESLSGWFSFLLKLFDRRFLEKSLVKSLNTLKNQAETGQL